MGTILGSQYPSGPPIGVCDIYHTPKNSSSTTCLPLADAWLERPPSRKLCSHLEFSPPTQFNGWPLNQPQHYMLPIRDWNALPLKNLHQHTEMQARHPPLLPWPQLLAICARHRAFNSRILLWIHQIPTTLSCVSPKWCLQLFHVKFEYRILSVN